MFDAGVRVPGWSDRYEDVSGHTIVLARTKENGSGGEGIIVIRQGDTPPEASLFTVYIPKTKEYRLHVVNEEVIAVQQKRRDSDSEQSRDERLIRNYSNGWVFCINDVVWPDDSIEDEAHQQAVAAVKSLGLDFGAVDLVLEKETNVPFVLEVNTAPGLESETVRSRYAERFKELYVN